MAPNWFIAFPMQAEGLRIPSPPRRVRVFDDADLHVTLAFLGSVQESEARNAWALAEAHAGFSTVTGSFDAVRPLGHPRKPSALCAMVAEGEDAFSAMIANTRAPLLEAAGAPPDERTPLPHMTVARIQRRATSAERQAALQWASTIDWGDATFTASTIALYTWSQEREHRLFRIVAHRDLAP